MALQMVDDVVLHHGREVRFAVAWMNPTPPSLLRRQVGQPGGDPLRLGGDPGVELSERQGAVPLDDGYPQEIRLKPTEGHGLRFSRGLIKDAFELAEPVAQQLRDVGEQLGWAPDSLGLGTKIALSGHGAALSTGSRSSSNASVAGRSRSPSARRVAPSSGCLTPVTWSSLSRQRGSRSASSLGVDRLPSGQLASGSADAEEHAAADDERSGQAEWCDEREADGGGGGQGGDRHQAGKQARWFDRPAGRSGRCRSGGRPCSAAEVEAMGAADVWNSC